MRLSRRRSGFTLIETLTAIAISAMLLAALASYAMAFMRTSREGEVAHRLQRELVFSLEAIASEVRVAKEVTTLGSPWTIKQITYDESAYGEREVQIHHDPDTRTLRIGSRVLSTNVASFSITPVALDEYSRPTRVRLYVETIDSLPMVSSGNLPMTLTDEVVLRNVGFTPPEEDPGGDVTPLTITINSPPWNQSDYPEEVSGQAQILLTWATNIPATCRLEWGTSPESLTSFDLAESGSAHEHLITGLPATGGNLYVRITANDLTWGQVKTTNLLSFPYGEGVPLTVTVGNPPWDSAQYPVKVSGKLQIRVQWTTSIGATCQLEWGTSPTALTPVDIGILSTSHNYLITNLPNQNGTLYVRITASDPNWGQTETTSLTGYSYTKP